MRVVSGGGENYWFTRIGLDNPEVDWEYTYASKVDSQGNIIVVGESWNAVLNNYNQLIAKINPNGQLLWQRNLGNSEYGAATCIAVDQNDNIYGMGTSEIAGSSSDMFVFKYSPSGTLQWQRRIGTALYDNQSTNSIDVDPNGNVIAVFNTNSSAPSYIIKYSSAGILQWQFAFPVGPALSGLAIDESGNIYTGGTIFGSHAPALIFKISPTGSILWEKALRAPTDYLINNYYLNFYSFDINSSGSVYAFGVAKHGPSNFEKALLVKFSSSGVIELQKEVSYVGSGSTIGKGIIIENEIYIVSSSFFNGNYFAISKLDNNFANIWSRGIQGVLYSDINSISANSLAVSLYRKFSDRNTDDGVVLKLPKNDPFTGVFSGLPIIEVTPIIETVSLDVIEPITTLTVSNLTEEAGSLVDTAGDDDFTVFQLPSSGSGPFVSNTPLQSIHTIRVVVLGAQYTIPVGDGEDGSIQVTIGGRVVTFDPDDFDLNGVGIAHIRGHSCKANDEISYELIAGANNTGTGGNFTIQDIYIDAVEAVR